MTPQTLSLLTPEIILIAAASVIYVAGAFVPARKAWSWLALGAIAAAALALFGPGTPTGRVEGPLASDSLAQFTRGLMLLLGGLFVMVQARSAAEGQTGEQVGSLLLVVAGAMLAGGSGELVLIFLGLELVSIPTYVLLYLGKHDSASQESAAKYFFLSIFSSAVLLYGFSFLYGIAGSTQLGDVYHAVLAKSSAPGESLALVGVALVLVFCGLAFKLAAVPFHFYAPDVYEGTSNLNAGLLAVAPKVAGLIVLLRIAVLSMPDTVGAGWKVTVILAIMTMTIGNVLALWQDNLRRMLAYSSIAHAGYMLMGVAAGFASGQFAGGQSAVDGPAAAVFYLAVYCLATLGAFAALVYLGGAPRGTAPPPPREIDRLDDLAGLGRARPLAAFCLAVFMFSLAGIPPLAGFFGKLTLFTSTLSVRGLPGTTAVHSTFFLTLAIFGAINAAIAAGYYLRVVAAMYFRPLSRAPQAQGGNGARAAMLAAALLVIGVGIFPSDIVDGANRAVDSAAKLHHAPPRGSFAATAERNGP